MKNAWLLVLIVILHTSCSRKSVDYLEKRKINVIQSRKTFGTGSNEIEVQYLGCGGLYVRHAGQAVMIDPFFSHQGFMKIGRSILLGGKIRSSKKQIDFGRKVVTDSLRISDTQLAQEVKAIFAAHGHYDHMMDIPFIYEKWLNKNAEVYANSSSLVTCRNVIDANHLHDAEIIASVRDKVGKSIDFTASDGSMMKVYPLFANHNPHAKNMKFFSGNKMSTPKRFNCVEDKTNVNDWLEGQTLSFLIDIVKNSQISFRIFIQSSSCNFPDGLPPETLLQQKSVDVAIMGSASYEFSENTYPCSYLDKMKPAHVMFIHWEDFFRKYQRKPKTVMRNNIPRLFEEIIPKCRQDYFVPLPGVVTTFKF